MIHILLPTGWAEETLAEKLTELFAPYSLKYDCPQITITSSMSGVSTPMDPDLPDLPLHRMWMLDLGNNIHLLPPRRDFKTDKKLNEEYTLQFRYPYQDIIENAVNVLHDNGIETVGEARWFNRGVY